MPSKTDDNVRPLSESINIATRSVHTKLNKLVIFRLPLALPPQADDASQYVSGLLHIAPIYLSFESLWRDILDSPLPIAETGTAEVDSHACTVCDPAAVQPEDSLDVHSTPETLDLPHQPVVCSRIHSLLSHLHLEGLQRTQALEKDLVSLTGWSSRTLAEQLRDNTESPILADFLTHTKRAVETHPHVLLAYAWVLYMALFSGGRFIRASLESTAKSFWIPASASAHATSSPSSKSPPPPKHQLPLEFFRFDTPTDGEDLKQTFKRRLAESESLLTADERDDIVQEARCIFDFMVRMVGELDDICGTDNEAGKLLSLRSRDSVVVEKERRKFAELARKVAKDIKNGSSEDGEGVGGVRFR